MTIDPRKNAHITIQKGGPARKGRITVLDKNNDGASLFVADEEVVPVGRDPQKCEIVISYGKISRVHCLIEYDGVDGAYIVTDVSTNGIYIQGNRMPKKIPVLVPAGTVVELADRTYRLSLE